ncbi:zinc finger SWIM domain-containing protein 7-like [Coccinella septempunctata]|uniref:zinc finger SWIM domain-containing protein 7-like n=1 Tax=Coccinella septempunctata TaxID=41139 RepID=UPI001D08826C|nr:zinc finger SWIM domain-containing protein 7-like [Coccinella septempunctata]
MNNNLSVMMPLAFESLAAASEYYTVHKQFTEEQLESLYDLFGNVFIAAAEFLENCKITMYKTEDSSRKVFKIGNKKEQYTIYENINFCDCPVFRYQVLELQNYFTCKHVLGVIIGRTIGKVTEENVSDSQMVDFLNEQLNNITQS